MVLIIRPNERQAHRAELQALFEFRRRVTIEDRGWDISTLGQFNPLYPQMSVQGDRYEIDPYDQESTVHLIAYGRTKSGEKSIIGSGRINLTTRPHMMKNVFADRCDLMEVPCDEHIVTISRCLIDNQNLDSVQQLYTTLWLSHAFTEYCIKMGYQQVSWFEEEFMYAKSVRFWRTQPLGLSKKYPDGKNYIASIVDTTPFALKRLDRALIGIADNVKKQTPNPRRLSKDQYDNEGSPAHAARHVL